VTVVAFYLMQANIERFVNRVKSHVRSITADLVRWYDYFLVICVAAGRLLRKFSTGRLSSKRTRHYYNYYMYVE